MAAARTADTVRHVLLSSAILTPVLTWLGVSSLAWTYGLLAFSLACVVGYLLSYKAQLRAVADVVGIYERVARLCGSPALFQTLGVAGYHRYYYQRREDAEIRDALAKGRSVVVRGRPLAGKTRAALEAIAATKPDAWLLAFAGPIRTEDINQIVVPTVFSFFKPAVVVFFDDLDRFSGFPLSLLRARLLDRCREVTFIATVSTGVAERVRLSGSTAGGVLDPQQHDVLLGPLTPEAADDIYVNVWKDRPGPLVVDRTLPGALVLGDREMERRYSALDPAQRRVLTALRLAAAAGCEPCDRELLSIIYERILGRPPGELPELLRQLEQDYIVVVDGRGHVAPAQRTYLDLDHAAYYAMISAYRADLARLEDVLREQGRARQLAVLGVQYREALHDPDAARRALAPAVRLEPDEPAYRLLLAKTCMDLGDVEAAVEHIGVAVESERRPDRKAELLVEWGDFLLQAHARARDAAACYEQALDLARRENLRPLIAVRLGDCLIGSGNFAGAEAVYRHWAPQIRNESAAAYARLAFAVLAQDRLAEATAILEQAAGPMTPRDRVATMVNLLANLEALPDGDLRIGAGCDAAIHAVMELAAAARRAPSGELLGLAGAAYDQALLSGAGRVYDVIVDRASSLGIDAASLLVVHINRGAVWRDQELYAPARECFDRAAAFARQHGGAAHVAVCAAAGLADCDIGEQGDRAADRAEAVYHETMRVGNAEDDVHAQYWACLGLGDVRLLQGRPADALSMYRQLPHVPDGSPGLSRLYLGMARAHLALSELAEADAAAREGLRHCARRDLHNRRLRLLDVQRLIDEERGITPAAVPDSEAPGA